MGRVNTYLVLGRGAAITAGWEGCLSTVLCFACRFGITRMNPYADMIVVD